MHSEMSLQRTHEELFISMQGGLELDRHSCTLSFVSET